MLSPWVSGVYMTIIQVAALSRLLSRPPFRSVWQETNRHCSACLTSVAVFLLAFLNIPCSLSSFLPSWDFFSTRFDPSSSRGYGSSAQGVGEVSWGFNLRFSRLFPQLHPFWRMDCRSLGLIYTFYFLGWCCFCRTSWLCS